MKKLFLTMLLMAVPMAIFAQFKVKSNGTALVGSTSYSFYTNTPTIKMEVHSPLTGTVDNIGFQSADLELIPGCQVIVMNNGRINMASGKTFNAPVGAIVDISHGTIN